MNAATRENPTGPLRKLAGPGGAYPYQGETSAEAALRQRVATGPLRALEGGRAAALTPSFTSADGEEYPPPGSAYDTSPGAWQRIERATRHWPRALPYPEPGEERRFRTIAELAAAKVAGERAEPLPVRVPDESARAHLRPRPRHALTVTEPAPAVPEPQPLPAAAPQPAPEPGPGAEPLAAVAVAEGLQKYLRELADYAALGVSALMAGHGTTPERIALAGRLARLGQALTLADDDEGALRVLAAEGGRQQ